MLTSAPRGARTRVNVFSTILPRWVAPALAGAVAAVKPAPFGADQPVNRTTLRKHTWAEPCHRAAHRLKPVPPRRPIRRACGIATALFAALTLNAGETKFWQQNDQADFEKGSFENISLRSDGRMFLAPSAREVFDSSTPYLWSIASDSKGALFTGGGGDGSGRSKLFEIAPDGKTRTLAELEGLEIHAIAIDKRDQVYAATAPDGKIYKVSRDGESQVYYDPHAKYIWAIAFDNSGNLFVATGDQGEIHRVTPDGKGSVFFRTEETHARSLAIDRDGNLIVGTEPGGLILRISPSGAGFVLYQAPKREITSVAVASDGAIYAAGVGTRSSAPPLVATPVTVPPSTLQPSAAGSSPGNV